MNNKIIKSFLLLFLIPITAQAQWPGQPGNTVGYGLIHSLTSTACPALAGLSSGTSGNPTVVHDCTYTSSGATVSLNFMEFVSVDWNMGTSGVNVTGTNNVFIGNRFQSNQSGFYNVRNGSGTNYFLASSFTPLTSLYTSPPGEIWPSAGTATNTLTMTSNVNCIDGNSGYQFGLNIFGGTVYVDSSDFWGFGNAIAYENATTTQQNITNNWIHDAANISPQGYHTDGTGFLETGNPAPSNIRVQGNVIASLGNSNAIAWQSATSGYAGMDIVDNYLSGFGNTDAPCEPGPTPCTNSRHLFNVWGTDIENYFEPLYAGAYPGTGNTWACNTLSFRAGTTWTNQNSNTPSAAINGKYWLIHSFSNGSTFASTTDQGGNAICGDIGPSSLDFLLQQKNVTSSTKIVTITQTNTGTLTISSAVLQTGTQFSIVSNTCTGASLTNGQSCTVNINFTPTVFGVLTDVLQIFDNMPAPNSPQQVVPIIGVGYTSSGATQVSTPIFSPNGGTFAVSTTATITSSTSGATICYSIDGSTPTGDNAGHCTHGITLTNGGTVLVSSSLTLKAIGTKSGDTDSTVGVSSLFTITNIPVTNGLLI